MTKGLVRSISRGPAGQRDQIALRFAVDATVTVDGATGVGFGATALGGLPEGHLLLQGARADLTFTESSASMIDAWNGDFSIGSTATADTTLDGTDVDIIASTALGPATSSVATAAANNVTAAVIDNSAGTGAVNLNMLVDDASISADDVPVAVTGYVTVVVTVLGDD